MKEDLDRLLAERGLDAIWVSGEMNGNPALYYMSNGAHILRGYVLKKRGQEPVLLCWPMEREEAAASGLPVVNLERYDYTTLRREAASPLAATVELYRRIFADLEVQGRVGFYGHEDQGKAWLLLNALQERLEGIEVTGEFGPTVIDAARATKDPSEIERIREVGRRTTRVVRRTVEFLRSHRVREAALVRADGVPLTIGEVHAQIARLIAEENLDDAEGFIFSIGRDATIPHNRGCPQDPVALGQTIVFDIFPRERGGGYFFDLTRTFCLGYAPPDVQVVYRDVRECQERMLEAYRAGVELRRLQQMACEFFASRGHPTIAENPQTESGYVHGLGHGVGLAIHEEPVTRDAPDNTEVLRPGHVLSCEPGLYYPDRGLGVRIEDTVAIGPDGAPCNLTDLPKDLVIEL